MVAKAQGERAEICRDAILSAVVFANKLQSGTNIYFAISSKTNFISFVVAVGL